MIDNISKMEKLFDEALRILEGKFDSDEKLFHTVFIQLVDECTIKSLKKPEDIPFSEEDYVGVSCKAQQYLCFIERIVQKLFLEKNKSICDETLCKVILNSLFVCLQYHNSKSLWSNESCAEISENIINILVSLAKFETEAEFLFGNEKSEKQKIFPNGIFKLLVLKNSKCFDQKTWKQNPQFIDSYFWMLFKIKGPQLIFDYIQYFLPPALFLLDDWELRHKIGGAKALTHILNETGYSDLRLFGRAEVVFDALKHQLYSREPALLVHIYPAVIKSAIVIEKDPKYIGSIKKNNFDLIMDHLIREMSFEEKLDLRSIYINNLYNLISAMELYSIRWTKEILNVCSYFLETFEGASACDRVKTIQVLKKFIGYSWPRIHDHLLPIMKMVCKVVYITSKSDSGVDMQAVKIIQEESRELISLLHAAAPLTFKENCVGMASLDPDNTQFSALLYVLQDVLNEL